MWLWFRDPGPGAADPQLADLSRETHDAARAQQELDARRQQALARGSNGRLFTVDGLAFTGCPAREGGRTPARRHLLR
ncbi:hypothetical protein ACFXPY_10660 [Streptomyces sp. NPDC059153]|uniref:hypothetical protein n=1 Tax=Streptomyces sp. NPDC059153 TaxID=3346743 RepID=UPI00367CA4B2